MLHTLTVLLISLIRLQRGVLFDSLDTNIKRIRAISV